MGLGVGAWERTRAGLTDAPQRQGRQRQVSETLVASENAAAGPIQHLGHYLGVDRRGPVVGLSSGKRSWGPRHSTGSRECPMVPSCTEMSPPRALLCPLSSAGPLLARSEPAGPLLARSWFRKTGLSGWKKASLLLVEAAPARADSWPATHVALLKPSLPGVLVQATSVREMLPLTLPPWAIKGKVTCLHLFQPLPCPNPS